MRVRGGHWLMRLLIFTLLLLLGVVAGILLNVRAEARMAQESRAAEVATGVLRLW